MSGLALATVLTPLATGSAFAKCSNNNPPDGAVIVCSTAGGDDTAGVRNAVGLGVTVDMTEEGAAIRPTDQSYGIRLGDSASITTGAGTIIDTADYGIRVLNDARLRIDGDIISAGKNRAAIRAGDRLSLVVGEDAEFYADGSGSKGIDADDDANIVFGGLIELSPTDKSGGLVGGSAGISVNDRANIYITPTGWIETDADGAVGILGQRDNFIRVDGTIVTSGGIQNSGFAFFPYGIGTAQGSTVIVGKTGSVTTSGAGVSAISLQGNVDPYSSNALGSVDIAGQVSASGEAASAVRLAAVIDQYGLGPVVNPQASVTVNTGAFVSSDRFIGIYEQAADADYRDIDTRVRVAGEVRSAVGLPSIYLAGGDDEVTLEPTAVLSGAIIVGSLDGNGVTTNAPGEVDTVILDGAAGSVGNFSLRLADGDEALNGFELFRKTGGGDWIVAGKPSNFAASGTVEAGRLFVDETVVGLDLRVLQGAMLSGSGTVGDIVADRGSTVAPRPAGLTSAGDVVLSPGATLAIGSDGNGHIARLDAAGAALIDEATLDIGIDPVDLAAAKGARVVSARGGVNGRFGTVRDAIPDIDVVPVYAAEAVELDYRLAAPGSPVTDKGVYAETMSALLESELGFAASLANRPGGANGYAPTGSIAAPLAYGSDGKDISGTGKPRQTGLVAWLNGLAGGLSVDGPDGSGFDLDGGGFVTGLEHRDDFAGGTLAIGVAAGYGQNEVDTLASSADGKTGRFGAYVGWDNDVWSLSAAGAVGIASIDTTRNLGFAVATSDADATLVSGSLLASYNLAARMGLPEGAVIAPYASFDVAHIRRGAFTEQGAGLLDLSAPAEDATRALAGLGMTFGTAFHSEAGWVATPSISIGYQRALGDRSVDTELALALVDAPFQQASAAVAGDRLKFGAGLTIDRGEALSLSATYSGAVGSGYQRHSGSLGLTWRF